MHSGTEFAECALNPKWDKYSYDQLDCQAFVEEVLKDIGVRKSSGKAYNWKGSNSMYRNYYAWRGSIDECKQRFGCIPVGAFVYIWKPSGEEEVGYSDGLGNCTHVGIYCGNDVVRDSTRSTKTGRNGVGSRSLAGFNKVTLFDALSYNLDESGKPSYNASVERILSQIEEVRNILFEMEGQINELWRG